MKSFLLAAVALAYAGQCANVGTEIVKPMLKGVLDQLSSLGNLELDETLNDVRGVWIEGKEVFDSLNTIKLLVSKSMPVVITGLDGESKQLLQSFATPLKHVNYECSEFYMLDTFKDMHGNVHYRSFNLPCGSFQYAELEVKSSDGKSFSSPRPVLADAATFNSNASSIASMIRDDVVAYLAVCGGINVNVERCFNWVQRESKGSQKRKSVENALKFVKQAEQEQEFETPSMIPEEGAVWREVVETTYRSWVTSWGNPFPFGEDQVVSHRMNTYWYIYLQAPPFQQVYYTFLLVDGLHNPNTQTHQSAAVGFFLSGLELNIHAERTDGEADPENIFWIKSSPPTQNTQHTVGKSWESKDTYSTSINLGFKGKEVHGDFNFNYTHTFTTSYSESRDITDWSVVENTDPVHSKGKWLYYQQWPVDTLRHSLPSFPQDWPMYYEQQWNPCRVREVPNLSLYALGTHNSMGKLISLFVINI